MHAKARLFLEELKPATKVAVMNYDAEQRQRAEMQEGAVKNGPANT
jgi:hypothetical protein